MSKKTKRAVEALPESDSDLGEESDDVYDEDEYNEDVVVEDVVDDLTYDVFNLTASNFHTIRFTSNDTFHKETVLFEGAKRAAQLLIKK